MTTEITVSRVITVATIAKLSGNISSTQKLQLNYLNYVTGKTSS
jgi:hypothetical protein